jgi:hypothetical protein
LLILKIFQFLNPCSQYPPVTRARIVPGAPTPFTISRLPHPPRSESRPTRSASSRHHRIAILQPPPPSPLAILASSAMSKARGGLGGAGAWALDAERTEEEEREAAAGFPRLREAAGAGKLKKKNKGTTLSLSEFAGQGADPAGDDDAALGPAGAVRGRARTVPRRRRVPLLRRRRPPRWLRRRQPPRAAR